MGRTSHIAGSTVRASVAMPLVRLLDEATGRADLLLAAHGLRRTEFTDPYALVPLSRFVALFEAAANLIGDPLLGTRLGSVLRPVDLGPIGLLFAASSTLRAALTALTESLSALQGGTLVRLHERGDLAIFSYRIEDAAIWPRVQDTDFTLAATLNLVRTLAGPNWKPAKVCFDHPRPSDLSGYRHVFGAPLVFDMPDASIVFPRADLDRTLKDADEGMIAVLRRHLDDLATEHVGEVDLATRVRSVTRLRLHREKITVERLARDLGLSTRSLQRELASLGTSVRDILREERQSIAFARLAASQSAGSVSQAIGYTDGTTFWRAFKAWTGTTPSRYRRGR